MTDHDATVARPPRLATSVPAVRAAGIAGLIFAILMTAALLLLRDAPPREVAAFPAWWLSYQPRYLVGLYLIPFAGIAFLWLIAAVRTRLGSREDQFFATVLLGSGLLFVAMSFIGGAAAAAASVLADVDDEAAYDVFVFGRALARACFFVFATKMAAAFMLTASTLGRRTEVLPRWFVVLGMILGVTMLVVVTAIELIALVFPAWVAILSVILLRARREAWEGAS